MMLLNPSELAQVRLDNAMLLFEEFVRATARHADAATLRGLEGRFAERVQLQPSYWSQIKGRSRQIGERLARQFEQLCHKPRGWLDEAHGGVVAEAGPGLAAQSPVATRGFAAPASAGPAAPESTPQDDDERFIVGLVLSYYRRHPQRARTRLLDILGEVLTTDVNAAAAARSKAQSLPALAAPRDGSELWQRTRQGVAPLKRKR
jgi:hypothetical protein